MLEGLEDIKRSFTDEVKNTSTASEVETLKVRYLGRKGPIQDLMKGLKELPKEERPQAGMMINNLKEELQRQCDEALSSLQKNELEKQLSEEVVDVTLPGRRYRPGRKHILTQVMDEIIQILSEMGFSVQYGPDIESDYYNFEALNFPPDHPARDMQDTFYLDDKILLRTHTSSIQARVMEQTQPPIRIIAPGRAYRNEAVTARSHVFFHQIEGFYIDKGVTFANLFSTLQEFLEKLMGKETEIRYRPSFFPFVEPGMEVDIRCALCKGEGCPMCKHTGWVEVMGAGMIHPEVLKNGAIDPEIYSGFAWGFGLERLVNIKHGVNDIRLFTQNDMRFHNQFSAV